MRGGWGIPYMAFVSSVREWHLNANPGAKFALERELSADGVTHILNFGAVDAIRLV